MTEVGPTLRATVGKGDLIETLADCAAVPPGPVHVRVYVVPAVSAPVLCCPVVGFGPDQPLDAVQTLALAAFQASVADAPLDTVLGLADRLTLGVADFTETVADWEADPPGPVQVTVKVVLPFRAPDDWEPVMGLLPDHPPDATQAVAPAADHDSIDAWPELMVLGLAVTLIVGVEVTAVTVVVCVALPPAPEQVSSNSVVC